MAVELASGYVSLIPSARGFGAKLAAQIGPEVAQAAGKAGAEAAGRFSTEFANKAISAGKKMTIGLTLPLALLGKASFDAASDLTESLSKVDVVFGKNSGEIKKWSQNAATNLRMSRQEALEAAGTFGNLFRALGTGIEPATKMSKQLVKLAADLGSFNNVKPEEALLALRSGLVGEAEPLRRFGVSLSEARVQAEGLKMGLGGVNGVLSDSEKVTARYAIIMKDTALAQGDAGKTAGTAAGQQAILRAQLKDTMADIGGILVPIVQKGMTAISGLAAGFRSLPPDVQTGIVAFGLFAAALGPIMVAGGNLIKFAGGIGKAFGAIVDAGKFVILNWQALIATAGTLALALGAVALVVGVGLAIDKFVPDSFSAGMKEAEQAAKRWGQETILAAKGTGDALATLKPQLTDLESGMKRQAAQGSLSAAQLIEYATKHKILGGEVARLTVAKKEGEAQDKATAAAIGSYITSIEKGGSATQAFSALTGDAQKAVETFQAAILASAGGQVAYQQSLINIGIAETELAAAVAEHGAASAEATAAQLALDQARLQGVVSANSLDSANQELIRSLITIPGYYDAEIARLNQLQREHPENAAGYQLEINKLNEAKAAADRLAGFLAVVTVDANTGPAHAVLDALTARLEAFARSQYNTTLGAAIGGALPPGLRAEGGPVVKGMPYIVGEEGWELFVPDQSGRIVPQSSIASATMPQSVGGGGGLRIENATFGDRNIIPDLDYWSRTRMAAS